MVFSLLISLAAYIFLVMIMGNEKILRAWERDGGDVGLLVFCAGFAPFPFINVFVLVFLMSKYFKYSKGK